MQKKIIALAVAALASSAAFAQTNVTVYGVVDLGQSYVQSTGTSVDWEYVDSYGYLNFFRVYEN